MIHPLRVLTSIAAITGGTVLAAPNIAAAQEATANAKSAGMSCTVDSHYYVTAECWRDGWKRGLLQWNGNNRNESLFVTDKRTDDRRVTAHVVWYHGGKHHRWVTDSVADGRGNEINLGIPEGTRVHLQLCLENVGCGPRYLGKA